MNRRSSRGGGASPVISSPQEKDDGCPASSASMVVESRTSGAAKSLASIVPCSHPLRNIRKRLAQTAQRGIGGKRAEEGLRANELLGRVLHLLGRRKRRPLRSKNGPPAVSCTAAKCSCSRTQQRQPDLVGPIIGKLRRCAVDHDEDRVNLLRKCRIELQFALAPRQAGRISWLVLVWMAKFPANSTAPR